MTLLFNLQCLYVKKRMEPCMLYLGLLFVLMWSLCVLQVHWLVKLCWVVGGVVMEIEELLWIVLIEGRTRLEKESGFAMVLRIVRTLVMRLMLTVAEWMDLQGRCYENADGLCMVGFSSIFRVMWIFRLCLLDRCVNHILMFAAVGHLQVTCWVFEGLLMQWSCRCNLILAPQILSCLSTSALWNWIICLGVVNHRVIKGQ